MSTNPVLLSFLFFLLSPVSAQPAGSISTVEYIQVVNDLRDETRFYYQHNWQILRQRARQRGFISGFQLLETNAVAGAEFDFILITTFSNHKSYEAAEANFQTLIDALPGPKLLNERTPDQFRRSVAVQTHVVRLSKVDQENCEDDVNLSQ